VNDPTQEITAVIDVPVGSPVAVEREGERIRYRLAGMDGERERLFRVNSGMGYCGRVVKQSAGVVILADARPLHAAPKGWPDLCGWTSVEITPEMVGQTVAIFTAEEFKGQRDALRPEQAAFKAVLERMGGIHRTVRP
jgi:hypothetical protein